MTLIYTTDIAISKQRKLCLTSWLLSWSPLRRHTISLLQIKRTKFDIIRLTEVQYQLAGIKIQNKFIYTSHHESDVRQKETDLIWTEKISIWN